MRIYSFDTLPSTQKWLIGKISEGRVEPPCAVIAQMQTDGVGSRENSWIGSPGNFFSSVALPENALPRDLPLAAASIYFACIMKKTLKNMGSETWVKWPNDLYIQSRKIGGCITAKKGKTVVAGIGVNIVDGPHEFGVLDIKISAHELLEAYLENLKKTPSWKHIFSNFRLEFENSKNFHTHFGRETLDLREAVLQNDGSLIIGKRRVVSLR
ncbi:biotin--[acetyl-CoA-carboxylase] ligase [Hydrogenimonas urashimensis]|uniref:biotin--[acetyl-CoA-carboxylase] ligase n=1 Tax=Hydrogenimonas urashimensis TaxID=2740515 RepID=UPI001915C772|nr:biotin--[acetyl-CoA-carboxylase] ligase [Hydrogenimonas urashimensis]